MPHQIQRYGWIPDLPDHRDHLYAAPVTVVRQLQRRADLTAECPPVYDQGQLGSCTANAIGAAFQFLQMKEKIPAFVPARLFVYYNERVIEGTVKQDSGAMIRDGIKSIARQGVCPETMWPYDPRPYPPNSHLTKKPSAACYRAAAEHTAVAYQRLVPTLNQLRGCLASGYPFVFGFTVYESFESATVARTGHAEMPGAEERALGGHAVLGVGYDDTKQWFVVRNSWGPKWGLKGYFTLPYAYLTDGQLADDFWTVRLVQ